MREIRTSSSMRGRRKRATAQRACALLYRSPWLGLPFASARERMELGHDPWIGRKIVQKHLEAGVSLVWLADDPELQGKRLCVSWWIWLKDGVKRDALGLRMKAATRKPFEWERGEYGTSYVSLYFPYQHSSRIKEQARKCTVEFVRVLRGCGKQLITEGKTK